MSTQDYRVGYANPPKHTQFKKGQSGNPKGRPKGTKNFATDLAEELKERILIHVGGKTKRVSKQRATAMSMVAKAVKGDCRAFALVASLMAPNLADQLDAEGHGGLSAFDAEILDRYLATRQASSVADAESPDEPSGGKPDATEAPPAPFKRTRFARQSLKGKGEGDE